MSCLGPLEEICSVFSVFQSADCFLFALLVFISHLLMSHGAIREFLVDKLGEKGFLTSYRCVLLILISHLPFVYSPIITLIIDIYIGLSR